MNFLINHQEIQIFFYVIISMLLGAAVGLDRELAGKPAGLRTHMLVAGVSTLFVSVAGSFIVYFGASTIPDTVRIQSDPIRVIEAVVTGVSFLGAGTIIRGSTDNIKGLTTAASLLFVAGIGICVAVSKFALAVALTLTTILVLRFIGMVEKK